MASNDDIFGQTFLQTGRLSPHRGVTDQWLRVWRLIIGKSTQVEVQTSPGSSGLFGIGATAPTYGTAGGGPTGDVAILSSEVPTGADPARHTYAAGLRIHFIVTLMTAQTPNTAEITLYNLRDDFAKNLIKEGQYVTLEAGYEWGNAGAIFTGTIKYFKVGHETATDSYLKIFAGDGELAYNNAVNNETLEVGTEPPRELQAMTDQFQKHGVPVGYVEPSAMKIPPRIREHVLFGMTAEQMRDFAQGNGALWHIYNERFNFQGPQSYQPGQVITLNAASGLIGFPEVTPEGINVTALINPAIRLRQRIRMNNKYINQVFAPGGQSGGTFFMQGAEYTFASLSESMLGRDGLYTPVQINYEGDSRGGVWYMYMLCLAVNEGASDIFSSVLGSVFDPF